MWYPASARADTDGGLCCSASGFRVNPLPGLTQMGACVGPLQARRRQGSGTAVAMHPSLGPMVDQVCPARMLNMHIKISSQVPNNQTSKF